MLGAAWMAHMQLLFYPEGLLHPAKRVASKVDCARLHGLLLMVPPPAPRPHGAAT